MDERGSEVGIYIFISNAATLKVRNNSVKTGSSCQYTISTVDADIIYWLDIKIISLININVNYMAQI